MKHLPTKQLLSVQFSVSRECTENVLLEPGLLKSSAGGGNLAWSQQQTGKLFFSFLLLGVIFVPSYSLQVVLQFAFINILF